MAVSAKTMHEYRATGGSSTAGGGFAWLSLVNSAYKWTASGSGTNEYYVELAAGGDPSLTEATSCHLDGWHNLATNGTLGSLSASQWDWGDNDTLGYSTVYVRLADGADPDTHIDDYVGIGPGGGTDYSQQDAIHATRTDLVIGSAGSEDQLSSVADSFASDDVGNLIQITAGTGFTTGFYEILSVAGGVATVDRNVGTADSTAGTGQLGGALDIPTDAMMEDTNAWIAGNRAYIKNDGTTTLLGSISTVRDGTAIAPFQWEGYNTIRGEEPTLTNRPLIAMGANNIIVDDYWIFRNFRATSTAAVAWGVDVGSVFHNVSVNNSSGTANRTAIKLDNNNATAYRCEVQSANGYAIEFSGGGTRALYCYIHDSVRGISIVSTSSASINGCVIDTCTTAIRGASNVMGITICGNVLYNSTKLIETSGTGDNTWAILNNILHTGTTGIDLFEMTRNHIKDFNVWYANTTDTSNADKGPNAVTGNPNLNDPANGDFTITSGSSAIDTALKLSTDMGLVGTYVGNIGVDQDDLAAGGAASILGGGALTGGFS